jgi:hypothetical protein
VYRHAVSGTLVEVLQNSDPFGLSLSKAFSVFFVFKEVVGFDRLSPNGLRETSLIM